MVTCSQGCASPVCFSVKGPKLKKKMNPLSQSAPSHTKRQGSDHPTAHRCDKASFMLHISSQIRHQIPDAQPRLVSCLGFRTTRSLQCNLPVPYLSVANPSINFAAE